MEKVLWHLTLSAEGRSTLYPSETNRRAAIHALARVGGDRLQLFSIVDDHVHVVVRGDRAEAGRLGRALRLALSQVASSKLSPSHVREVEGRNHLMWLVRYLLTQPAKHGLDTHPALYTGSCFPDLVGARLLPGVELKSKLEELLPRLRPAELYGHVGLPEGRVAPAGDEGLRLAGVFRIKEAAGSALAAPPSLEGNSRLVVTARRAAASLASRIDAPVSEVARALNMSRQAADRLTKQDVEPRALEAVRVRIALEETVWRNPMMVAEPPRPYPDHWGDPSSD